MISKNTCQRIPYRIVIVNVTIVFIVSIMNCGGGGGGDGSDDRNISYNASNGYYSGGSDNNSGISFEVNNDEINNLRISMTNPPTDGSCIAIIGASFIRPGESEPFMEFVKPLSSGSLQEILYFGPIEIDDSGRFTVEESISPTTIFCEQNFKISGTIDDSNQIDGIWQYTIDNESTTGSFWAELMSVDSDLVPITLPIASIIIDGDRSDWQGIEPIAADDEGDEDPDANFVGTDLKALYMARDDDFLYHMITLYDGDPPAGRNLLFVISYDKYPIINGGTVPGDQFSSVTLSTPKDDNIVVDIGERAFSSEGSDSISQYGSDYAKIGDNFIEYKIPLKDIQSIDKKYTDLYVHMLDSDDDGLLIYGISDEMDSMARIADSGDGYFQ